MTRFRASITLCVLAWAHAVIFLPLDATYGDMAMAWAPGVLAVVLFGAGRRTAPDTREYPRSHGRIHT